jgi:hypothetical protein
MTAQPGTIASGPYNVTTTTVSEEAVEVSWSFEKNPGESGNKNFVIQVIPSTVGASPYYVSAYGDAKAQLITNLPTAYTYFRVYAVNDVGWSQDSQYNIASTITGNLILPKPPTDIIAVVTPTTATIAFTPGNNGTYPATNYTYSFDNITYTEFSPPPTSQQAPILYTFKGLNTAQIYTLYLKLQTTIYTSPPSNPITFAPSPQYRLDFSTDENNNLKNALGDSVPFNPAHGSLVSTPDVLAGLPKQASACLYIKPDAANVPVVGPMPFTLCQNITVAMWIKPTLANARAMIVSSDANRFTIELWNGGLTGGFGDPGYDYPPTLNTYAYPTNVWTHVAITIAKSTQKMYINGTLYASVTLSNTNYYNQTINAVINGAIPAKGVCIYDYQLLSHVLTPNEIQALAWA